MSETKPEKSHQDQASPLFAMLSFCNQAMLLKRTAQGAMFLKNRLTAIARLFQGKWESYFYGILPHPSEPRVLMLCDRSGYFLPYVRVNKIVNPSNFATIKQVIEEELGISVNILYSARKDYDKSKGQIRGVYVLEQNGSITQLQEGSWIDIKTLGNLSLKQPEHKLVIAEYLKEIESDRIPELRPPWDKVGWFDCATQWIEEQLLELNYKQLSPVECIKSWGISCILRVNTSAGNIYLKEASTLPLFCNEPAVTAELANLFPGHIPTVLSINPERHWMLLGDFGEPIGRNAPIKVQKDVYRLLAQIQIKSIEHRDNLLSIGCLDRRLPRLEAQIDDLFNDENVLSQMNTAEINQLNILAPYLKNLCFQLAEYQIPQTLVHGDLHLANVAFYQNNYLLFDWTDSCISHPFFDMFELFFPQKNKFFLSHIKGLRDEYLTQWTLYEPKSRLIEAWKIAKPLCALHHAVTYQYIIACLEPRSKQELNGLPIFLRRLLKCSIKGVEK